MALHRGWVAFGVELDSFCERETNPTNASIPNVGMESLLSSKLYGQTRATPQPAACAAGTTCTSPTLSPSGCTPGAIGSCRGCDCGTLTNDATFTPFRPAGSGPGKHNFIGFGDQSAGANPYSALDLATIQELGAVSGTPTTDDNDCDLQVDTYEMGVYGHIAGNIYYGISIGNTGVLSAEVEKNTTISAADANCS